MRPLLPLRPPCEREWLLTRPSPPLHLLLLLLLAGQDVFLLSSPGPYTRRLAQTFLSLLNTPYEIVTLHRDVGESELKQGREIRPGGKLEWTDSGAVRAAKEGKVLILDGIERVERGVLPLLNNLLEYREMVRRWFSSSVSLARLLARASAEPHPLAQNLEDGTHLVSAARYDKMVENGEDTTSFIPTHPDFRIIALGVPVPPYPGLPIDPPFRSRFQARYVDPVAAAKVMARQELGRMREAYGEERTMAVEDVVGKMGEVMASLQIAREMRASPFRSVLARLHPRRARRSRRVLRFLVELC